MKVKLPPLWESWSCCTLFTFSYVSKEILGGHSTLPLCPLDNGWTTTVCTWLCNLSGWREEDKSSLLDRESWWHRAIHLGLDSSTFSYWTTVEKKVRWRKNRAKDKEKREGTEATHTAIPHVYLWASSLKSLNANNWLWMHAGLGTDLLMSCLRT